MPARDFFLVFWKGTRMDLSFGAYIMLVVSLVLAAGEWGRGRRTCRVMNVATVVLLVVVGGIVTGDLEVFRNWGYHVDGTLFLYLATPGMMIASVPASLVAWLLFAWAAWVMVLYALYRVAVHRSLREREGGGRWWHAVAFLLLGGTLVLPPRGGLNVAQMNASFVFFHPTNMYANQAAVNPAWNFLYEALQAGNLKEDFSFMPAEEARRRVDSLYREAGDFPRVLKVKRPNVVVLILESFTSNAWEVMHETRAVAREGIYFSNIHATGNRSDRGLSGVISGFPAYPGASLLKYPGRMNTRARFPLDLEREGYSTTFYYAGDLNFGGFRSYVTMTFQRFITEEDFSGEAIERRFKWGVHDEFMLERLHEEMTRGGAPALHVAFTMSSHEPFEVPGASQVAAEDTGKKLERAIGYTDDCLGRFFRRCKESGAWDNTLFVLVADHGSRHVRKIAPYAPGAYKIPLVFTGGAMRVRDSLVMTLGSQTDVVATLLAQLEMDHSRYRYSKNLLNPRALPFAYYAYSHAAALLDERGACILDLKSGENLGDNNSSGSRATLEAYLQVVEQEFKGYDARGRVKE